MVTFVKWNNKYDRYYYIFKVEELIKLFEMTNWNVEKHFWDHGNEIFILNKN